MILTFITGVLFLAIIALIILSPDLTENDRNYW